MDEHGSAAGAPVAPAWGELRYGAELARLLVDGGLRDARAVGEPRPVLLVPGFMAGDASLLVMRAWLRRRGHRVAMSGIVANVDCAGRAVARLERQLERFAGECGRPVALVGQSRGGTFSRALAVRRPELVCALAMLGSPVRDGLAVSERVLRTVRWLAWLGDLGFPGVLSTGCRDGECCSEFNEQLSAPLPAHVDAVSVYSRSDGVVDWRVCVDPHARAHEVASSHCGMSVHADVYRALEPLLEDPVRTRRARRAA
ncbi:MAG TPA: alpha/beta hydrolase [Solirubrobacteraceae bacterium]|nr:alpha/beta hydrolase [Solirubrobacteraceae bacterium]